MCLENTFGIFYINVNNKKHRISVVHEIPFGKLCHILYIF